MIQIAWQFVRGLVRGFFGGLNAQSKKLFGVPLGSAVVVGSGVVAAALWLGEHDAHVRQAAELDRLKQQTAANVSALEARAQAAIREANQQHGRAVAKLEARERGLADEAARLGEKFSALENQQQSRRARVAALPASALANDVAARLGVAAPQGFDQFDGGQRIRPPHALTAESAASGAGTSPASQMSERTSGPAPDPPSSAASVAGANGSDPCPGRRAERREGSEMPGFAAHDKDGEPATNFVSESTLRKIDSALVELDGCREAGAMLEAELKNRDEQISTEAATIVEQAAAAAKLNQAIQAKDQALAETEAASRRELKLVRGSRLQRLGRVVEHVAIGVVIGALLR